MGQGKGAAGPLGDVVPHLPPSFVVFQVEGIFVRCVSAHLSLIVYFTRPYGKTPQRTMEISVIRSCGKKKKKKSARDCVNMIICRM